MMSSLQGGGLTDGTADGINPSGDKLIARLSTNVESIMMINRGECVQSFRVVVETSKWRALRTSV